MKVMYSYKNNNNNNKSSPHKSHLESSPYSFESINNLIFFG